MENNNLQMLTGGGGLLLRRRMMMGRKREDYTYQEVLYLYVAGDGIAQTKTFKMSSEDTWEMHIERTEATPDQYVMYCPAQPYMHVYTSDGTNAYKYYDSYRSNAAFNLSTKSAGNTLYVRYSGERTFYLYNHIHNTLAGEQVPWGGAFDATDICIRLRKGMRLYKSMIANSDVTPMRRSDGVVGLMNSYTGVFEPSITGEPFIAGPDV